MRDNRKTYKYDEGARKWGYGRAEGIAWGTDSPILGIDGRPLLCRPRDWNGLILERKEIPVRAECGPQFSRVRW